MPKPPRRQLLEEEHQLIWQLLQHNLSPLQLLLLLRHERRKIAEIVVAMPQLPPYLGQTFLSEKLLLQLVLGYFWVPLLFDDYFYWDLMGWGRVQWCHWSVLWKKMPHWFCLLQSIFADVGSPAESQQTNKNRIINHICPRSTRKKPPFITYLGHFDPGFFVGDRVKLPLVVNPKETSTVALNMIDNVVGDLDLFLSCLCLVVNRQKGSDRLSESSIPIR